MRERSWLTVLLVIGVLVSFGSAMALESIWHAIFHPLDNGVYRVDGVEVTNYEAVFDGFRLEEKITYKVAESGYTMVYRSFDTPLYFSGDQGQRSGVIIVESVVCPPGFYWYVYDAGESLATNAPEDVVDYLLDRLSRAGAWSEAGCYRPDGLGVGEVVSVVYRYRLVPPGVISDGKDHGYTFTLANGGEHILYHNITIVGINGTLVAILPPQGGGRLESRIEISALPSDVGLDLVIVTGMLPPQGVREEFSDSVKEWLNTVSIQREKLAKLAFILLATPLALASASPFVVFGLYLVAGRERPPIGSIPYGYPPKTGEKPWEVAARYITPGKLSANLIAAVLIDLYVRGYIKIDESKRIRVVKTDGLDDLEFLIARAAEEPRGSGSRLREAARIIARIADEAVDLRYKWVLVSFIIVSLILPIAGGFILSGKLNIQPPNTLFKAMIYPAIIYGLALAVPVNVLGRWRPGYREKAEAWIRFARVIKIIYPSIVVDNPGIAAYVASVSDARTTRRILAEIGFDTSTVNSLLSTSKVVRRRYLLYIVRSSAVGSGAGFGGGGAGAR